MSKPNSTVMILVAGLPERLELDLAHIRQVAQSVQDQGLITRPEMLALSAPVQRTCTELLRAAKQLDRMATTFASGDRAQGLSTKIKGHAESLQSSAVSLNHDITIQTRLFYREPVVAAQLSLLRTFTQQVELLAAQALLVVSVNA